MHIIPTQKSYLLLNMYDLLGRNLHKFQLNEFLPQETAKLPVIGDKPEYIMPDVAVCLHDMLFSKLGLWYMTKWIGYVHCQI